MTWIVLGAFVLVFLVPGMARRRHEFFSASRSGQVTIRGVEGVKKLSKEKKAALNAASALLR